MNYFLSNHAIIFPPIIYFHNKSGNIHRSINTEAYSVHFNYIHIWIFLSVKHILYSIIFKGRQKNLNDIIPCNVGYIIYHVITTPATKQGLITRWYIKVNNIWWMTNGFQSQKHKCTMCWLEFLEGILYVRLRNTPTSICLGGLEKEEMSFFWKD